jgi:amino acid transporter
VAGPKNKIKVTSPVAGLRRAQLTFIEVLGQSRAAVAPSAVMVTLPALVMPDAGRATIAVFVVAALLITAVGYCVSQFTSRMVAVSGLYSYVVKGLGSVPGFGAGWSLVIGYAAAAMASVLGAAGYLGALLGRIGLPAGTLSTSVLAVVVGLIAFTFMVRGIQLSARVSLAIEVFAIVAATAVLIVAFVQSAGTGDAVPMAPDDSPSGSTIGFGLLIAITSFVGFESVGTVAREARNPLVAVTRAIRWTPIALGALSVPAAALQLADSVGETGSSFVLVLSLPDSAGSGASVLSIFMEWASRHPGLPASSARQRRCRAICSAMGLEGVVPRAGGGSI